MNVAEYLKPYAIGRKLIEYFVNHKNDFDSKNHLY